MTEKRFQIKDSNSHYVGYDIIDHQNFYKRYYGGRLVQAEELCDLLNEQHKEKEELIYALNQRTEQCDKLHEENEQLKGELRNLRRLANELYMEKNE